MPTAAPFRALAAGVFAAFLLAGCASSPSRLPGESASGRGPASATSPTSEPALEPIWPPLLRPGDTIQFVAPAGQLDRERMARARARLEARGYRVVERDDLYAAEGYLAGSDERRAAELMQAFLDPEVGAIFTGTGGYGTMRILDRLDYDAIRRRPKVVVGFSDITALHAAIFRRAGVVGFHSPAPMWTLGGPDEPLAFPAGEFFRAIEAPTDGALCGGPIEVPPEAPQPWAMAPGRASGILVGGNLSMVAALEGTPFAVETRGRILLLEDVGEASYRIDRMLRQLELAGRLDDLAGVILGQFTRESAREDAPRDPDPRYTIEGVLRQYFERRGVPVIANFPIGHVPMNATLPIGGVVALDADADPPFVAVRPSADPERAN